MHPVGFGLSLAARKCLEKVRKINIYILSYTQVALKQKKDKASIDKLKRFKFQPKTRLVEDIGRVAFFEEKINMHKRGSSMQQCHNIYKVSLKIYSNE